MKIFKILISAVAALVIFSSCQQNESNLPVYKEVITKSNLLEIVNQIETSEEVDSEELQLFSAGIARLGVKDSLAGLSVGEVIAMQREFQRKQALPTHELKNSENPRFSCFFLRFFFSNP